MKRFLGNPRATHNHVAYRIAFIVVAMTFMLVQAHAQTTKVKKPEPLGYGWADKFLNEVYLLDVDVESSTKQIDDSRHYLVEMAEDPVVFLKNMGTSDFNAVVALSRQKFEQGKAAKKTIDEIFADADFDTKIKKLGEQLNTLGDQKALSSIGKNIQAGIKNLETMPKTIDKLTTRTKSIIAQGDGVLKQADQLDMFKKAPVVSTLSSSLGSLKGTAEKMPALGDVSVKTLGLYKQVMSNIKIK